ncbi:hypothetical protein PENARI_c004G04263 [Penicillium arizonense]|uniref:Uncharacterized protein n=1 Tax=Penicillium arizonense TaxID=1835702 RepID=A0A1F5LQF4_PENAI|nr:hypothetical protein PENARI_c004G04263 [Penicillium arizonense]OGE55433.1 hypothetical protein PENARI_c004G04263 [Penicillium arizonense]
MCSTTARPGTLIESNAHENIGDALKWKDVALFMVKHPEDPNRRELLMRVRHRLMKRRRNKGTPPYYTYTERNDSLGLCVIQDILTYAFLDDAFDSPYLKTPRDIWRLTDIPEHRLSTPIHFKKSIREVCIMRRTMYDEAHGVIMNPVQPWKCKQAEKFEKAASALAGFKDEGTFYKYRKGAAAEVRHLDEYSRNIVMGHENGKTFAKYVSVRDDVQSAFMGTPARKALLDLSCNASLTRDISAPNSLNEAQKLGLELDPDLTRLKEATALLRRALIKDFGQLEKARKFGESRYRELRRLQEAIRTHRKRLFNAAKKRNRDHFFDNIGNRIIEANHQGNPIKFNPDLSHIQPERKYLADLEFKNRDTDNLDRATLIEDRIRSLELRLQLEKLHIPQGLHRKIDFSKMERKIADVKEEDAKQANSTEGFSGPAFQKTPATDFFW